MLSLRHTLVVVIACLGLSPAFSQFGLGARYQSMSSGYWEDAFALSDIATFNGNTVGLSAYYWLRLKNTRVEFLPEVGYALSIAHTDDDLSTRLRSIPLIVNTDIYILDLLNDCDCPTFSKQGSFFQRGFFIEVSGGVDFQTIELENPTDETVFDVSESIFRAGLGAGLDIGVSDLLTITPIVFMHWHSRPEWAGLPEAIGVESNDIDGSGDSWYRGFTIRAIFRPDYLARNRY